MLLSLSLSLSTAWEGEKVELVKRWGGVGDSLISMLLVTKNSKP
jgi:hypothetical protein